MLGNFVEMQKKRCLWATERKKKLQINWTIFHLLRQSFEYLYFDDYQNVVNLIEIHVFQLLI